MKKTYQEPVTRVIPLSTEKMLAQSRSVRGNSGLQWSNDLSDER